MNTSVIRTFLTFVCTCVLAETAGAQSIEEARIAFAEGRFTEAAASSRHWWTYPRTPKMNAHAERFNRTLQEQFVDYHEDLLFDDLVVFSRHLADWLPAYNTVLPHHSLDRQSPIQFLIQHQPECQRWWPHTHT